jgi:hypothetical protein
VPFGSARVIYEHFGLQLDPTAPPGPDGPGGWVAVWVDAGADSVLVCSALDTGVEVWLL